MRKKVTIEDEDLVPEIAKPILYPIKKEVSPLGGRPARDETDKFLEKIEVGKEYYLRNAQEAILQTALLELTFPCKDECPYESACALKECERPRSRSKEIDKFPYGDRCPVEGDLFMRMFYGYIAELQLDGQRPTELASAAELAGIHVWRRRIDILIRDDSDGKLMIEQGMGINKKGDEIVRRELHPLIKYKSDLEKRQTEIKKEFVATREAMAKAQVSEKSKGRLTMAELLSGTMVTDAE